VACLQIHPHTLLSLCGYGFVEFLFGIRSNVTPPVCWVNKKWSLSDNWHHTPDTKQEGGRIIDFGKIFSLKDHIGNYHIANNEKLTISDYIHRVFNNKSI